MKKSTEVKGNMKIMCTTCEKIMEKGTRFTYLGSVKDPISATCIDCERKANNARWAAKQDRVAENEKLGEEMITKFYQNYPWRQLNQAINVVLGFNPCFEPKLVCNESCYWIKVEGRDIPKDSYGIFAHAIKNAKLTLWNEAYWDDSKGWKDDDQIWADVHITYEHKDGGTNALRIGSFRFSPDDNCWIKI